MLKRVNFLHKKAQIEPLIHLIMTNKDIFETLFAYFQYLSCFLLLNWQSVFTN